jgi:Asp-tRNA(Asn)/Glu-tRNA(Gln) amidotransferase A subunit family amidase
MAGLVGVATATDGGGSIRIPASFCGLVGIKPTNGLIGRWPAHDWIDYSTDGPFATSSDDLRLLLDVMAGPVAGDPTAATRAFLANMTRLNGRPLRVFAAERTSPFGPLPGGVERAFHDSVNAFAEVMKASISWRDAEGFFVDGDPDLDWFTVTTAEHVASLGRAWVEEHMDEFHVSSQEFLSAGLAITAEEYLAARRRRFLYVRTLDELLGEDGVLLTPTLAAEGCMADGRLRPDAEVHGLPPEVYSTAMQNITGHPALSLPFGMLPTGLPFGLQVTAGHYDDYKLLDIADLMEAAHPWARTAPGYESLANVLLA